jgi:release factor glutamine methyltransferase
MTVLETIQRGTAYLQRKGVESPRLQTELLMAHHLRLPRMQLYLSFEQALTPEQLESIRTLITRRGKREPLQQIVGSTSFCGLEIFLNRQVLVPRPETELVAEYAWKLLAERAATQPGPVEVLDFGTGSGCLAVTLAVKCPHATICALDISREALDLASRNAAQQGVAERIQFLHTDGFAALPKESRFALMVANPPYIPTAEIAALQPEVRDYEPHQALDGGADGLRFYREFAAQAPARLQPGGQIVLEFGDGQEQALGQLFDGQNWIVEQILEDYTHRPRVFVARHKTDEKS